MNKRTNMALFFLLLLQVVLIAYMYRPGREAGPPEVVFFKGLTPDRIVKVVISGAGNHSVSLEKHDKGGWVIASADNYPVNGRKLADLLKKITSLRSRQLVTRTRTSHERFKLGKTPNREIVMTLTDGTTRVLRLGTSPNYRTVHVRAGDADEIYLVRDLALWEVPAEASAWWRPRYVDLDPQEVDAIVLTNHNGSLAASRDQSGKWTLAAAGQALSKKAVDDLLTAVGRLTVGKYLGREEKKEYGLAKPAASLRLTLSSGDMDLRVGARLKKEGDYVVKSSASPFYVQVPEYALKELLDQRAAALLEKGSSSAVPAPAAGTPKR